MSKPVISVVIPALNAAATIGDQLAAILGQDLPEPFEVVVADNGSVDDTRRVVRDIASQDDRLRLVDASSAPGNPGAKNVGVREARAPLIAFVDADDVVASGWLTATFAGLQRAPAVVMTREYWALGVAGTKHFREQTRVQGSFGGAPTVSGGAFGIHRDLYLRLGGFDASFPGAADAEFGLRLWKELQQAPLQVPEAVVHVRDRQTGIEFFRRSRALGRSTPLLLDRHGDVLDHRSARVLGYAALWLLLRAPAAVIRPVTRLNWMRRFGRFVGEIEGHVALLLRRHIAPR